MGGFHHALQPLTIGGDQRHVFTGHQLCPSNSFQTGLVDVGHEPKLIDALDAVRRSHLEINLMLMDWRTESCRQTQHGKMRENAHLPLPPLKTRPSWKFLNQYRQPRSVASYTARKTCRREPAPLSRKNGSLAPPS